MFRANLADAQDLPSGEELLSIESYQKVHPKILKSGRLTHALPKELAKEDIEDFLAKAQESDPVSVPLEPLSADSAKNWFIKFEGDATMIASASGENAQNRQLVHLRNKNWKGSHNIYDPTSGKWAFFYCGTGINQTQKIYPLKFYQIQKTVADLKEFPEPNGEEEKKEEEDNLETESADLEENKKESTSEKGDSEKKEVEENKSQIEEIKDEPEES